MRGKEKKLEKGVYLNNTKKYSFLQRSIYTWTGLKEEVNVKNLHN